MPKYEIGDKVWIAQPGQKQVRKTCPICFGKLEVKLTLGDDSEVMIQCDYCGKGFSGPQGYVMEYEYCDGANQITIQGMNVSTVGKNEEEVEYKYNWCSGGGNIAYEKDVYATQEEAIDRSNEIREQRERVQSERTIHLKKMKSKNFSWNAGYWLKQAKDAEQSAERYRNRARICKSRAKANKGAK